MDENDDRPLWGVPPFNDSKTKTSGRMMTTRDRNVPSFNDGRVKTSGRLNMNIACELGIKDLA